MPVPPELPDFADLEVRVARSRRRSAARRSTVRRRRRRPRRLARAAGIAAVSFALAGGMAAEAQTPAKPGGRSAAPVAEAGGCPIPARFRGVFVTAAREHRLAVNLLAAVAYEESRMDPSARSPKGALGLLQLMPATARALGADPTVLRENVHAGARYLSVLLTRFGNLDLALAAYNAGPTAVARAGRAPSLETLAYVLNVRKRASRLLACG